MTDSLRNALAELLAYEQKRPAIVRIPNSNSVWCQLHDQWSIQAVPQ